MKKIGFLFLRSKLCSLCVCVEGHASQQKILISYDPSTLREVDRDVWGHRGEVINSESKV